MAKIDMSAITAAFKAIEKNRILSADGKFGLAIDVIPETDLVVVPTGHPSLDIGVCTVGGIPLNGITEIYGKPSGGKSTIAVQVIANAQKMGLPCALIDAERGFCDVTGREWLMKNGVDLSILWYSNQDCAEYALIEAADMIRAGFKVVVIDSVGSLIPEEKLLENMKRVGGVAALKERAQKGVATLARALSDGIKQLGSISSDRGAAIICINQVRDAIGAFGYGDNTVTPGGWALEHGCKLRLAVNKVRLFKDKGSEDPVGAEVCVKCVKSKVSPPGRRTGPSTEYPNPVIYFDGRKADYTDSVVTIAINMNIITRPGGEGTRKLQYIAKDGTIYTAGGLTAMVSELKTNKLGDELYDLVHTDSKLRAELEKRESLKQAYDTEVVITDDDDDDLYLSDDDTEDDN